MIIYLLIYATSTVYAVLGDIELTQTTSLCVGEGNVLNVTCPTGSIIAVSRFYYGFWNRTCNKTADECCVYQKGDCLQTEHNVTDILEELSGKKQMTISPRVALAGESCQNQTNETMSTYNQLDYFCINETRMWDVSENVSAEGDLGGPIYLHSRAYPEPVPDQHQANYTCSVEATTMTTLTLFRLHVDLKCDQTIDIRDGDSKSLLTMNCVQSGLEKNFSTSYIMLTFTNDASQSGGKFWLGFTAADAGTRLRLRCPAVAKELFKECDELHPPQNGNLTLTGTSNHSTANYFCLEYYNLTSGDATRTCQANGSWSGTEPVCSPAIDCGTPESPPDGTVNVSSTTYYSVATYACSEYYTITSGNSSRTCLPNGSWSGEKPVCSLTVECIQDDHCSKTYYECDPEKHECIYICGFPIIQNGNANIDRTRPVVGSIATFSCNDRYSLSGVQTRTCQENKGWSGDLPKCLKDCDRPKAPENGNMSLIGSGSNGTVAIFTCNNGYSIHGSQRLDCREDSKWSDEQPVCLLTEKSVQTQSDQTGLAVTIPIILILLAALILFILYHKGLCNKCQKHEILVEEGKPTDEETKKDIASQSMSNLISKEKNQAKDISTESDAVDKKCPIASAEGVDLDHVYDNPEDETRKKDDKDQANANKESEQESNKNQADNASTYENVSDTKREDAEKPGMSPSEGQNKAEVPVPTDNATTKISSQVIESSGNPDAKGNDVPTESGGPDTKSAAHIVEGMDGSKGDTVQTGSTEKPLIEFDTEDKKNSKEESTAKEETNAANGVQNTKEGDVKIDKDN